MESRKKYRVYVQFNKNFIEEKNGVFTVGVRAKPEGGKANEELRKKLARHFGVSLSHVRIVVGHTSRNKIIEVQ